MPVHNAFKNKIFLYVAIIAGSFLLALHVTLLSGDWLPIKDNYYYAYPYFDHIFSSLSKFEMIPFWNQYVNLGEPTFLYLNHMFLLHVPNVITYLLSPVLALMGMSGVGAFFFSSLLGVLIQSIGISVLVKDLTKDQYIACYALILSCFSGLAVGELHQNQINASILYVPWIAVFLIRWITLDKVAFLYLAVATLSIAMLNHYPNLLLYIVICVGISLYSMARPTFFVFVNKIRSLKIYHFIFLTTLSLVILSPLLVIFFQYSPLLVSPFRDGSLTSNYAVIAESRDSNSFSPHVFFHFFFPRAFLETGKMGNWVDNSIFYIGIIPIVLSLLFFFDGKNDKHNFYKLLFILLLIVGLGGHSFGYFLIYSWIPFAEYQRIPLHFSNYMVPLLIICSSFGLKSFKHQLDFRPLTIACWFFITLIGIAAFHVLVKASIAPNFRIIANDTALVIFFSLAFLWWASRSPTKRSLLSLFIFVMIDLLSFHMHRTSFVVREKAAIPPYNHGLSFSDFSENRIYEIYNLKTGRLYTAMPTKVRTYTSDMSELVTLKKTSEFRRSHISFKEKNSSVDRFYFIEKLNNGDDLDAHLLSLIGKSDFFAKVRSFSQTELSQNHIEFKFNNNTDGWFVYLDAYDSGWTASVNGVKQNLSDDSAFKAVYLKAGTNIVTFEYFPKHAWFLIISLITQLCFLGAFVVIWFRRLPEYSVSTRT
jgi:hypothetical protein